MKLRKSTISFLFIISLLSGSVIRGDQIYTFKTPEHSIQTNSEGFHVINIPGYFSYAVPGFPDVPVKIFRIAVPPTIDINSIKIKYTTDNIFYLGRFNIKELPGLEAWVDNNQTAGRKANIYTNDSYYPEQIVENMGVSQMRKWRILNILYSPFQYNPATQNLRFCSETTVTIQYTLQINKTIPDTELSDKIMEKKAVDILLNHSEAQSWYQPENPSNNPVQSSTYCIITTNSIESASTKLEAFKSYLIAKGYSPLVITEDEFGSMTGQSPNGTAEKIREWLINNYISGSIEYVLLIGNPNPTGDIPMKMCWPRFSESTYRESPTDYFYADLTGNWNLDGDSYFGEYPDDNGIGGVDFSNEVYVGRIPVYSGVTSLDSVLTKTMNYGNSTDIAWRKNTLLPMSYSDSITDGAYLGEAMKNNYLTPSGYSSWTLYMQGSVCASANSSFVSNGELLDGATKSTWISNPYGMVWWWGHGSSSSASLGYSGCGWGTILNSSDTSSLNDSYPSFVYQCSCSNGYPESSNNLGTKLLYQGAIGTVSASRVSWYAVTTWYTGLKYYCDNASIGYYYGQEISANEKSAAKALYDVKSDMGANHYTYWGGCHWMNLFDFNLYGDPSISIAEYETVHTVSDPDPPSGPSEGEINTTYTFSTGNSSCSQGHDIEYHFDWGDGNYSDWSIATSADHSWSTANSYLIKAQARCSVNHSVVSSWSAGTSITIYTCLLPTSPENPTPMNGLTIAAPDTDLDWNDCLRADSYDVYFGTSSSPPYYGNTTISSYTLPQLNNNTVYYWRIVSKNSCGNTTGETWNFKTKVGKSAVQKLSDSGTPSTFPAVARSGNNLYIAWKEDNLVYFKKNSSKGDKGFWTSETPLTSWGEVDTNHNPIDIAASGNYVYIVMAWRSSAAEDYEILVKKSTDYGNSWGNWFRLSYNAGESQCPSIACNAAAVYIAWQDNNPGNYEIYFKRSENNGSNWGSAKRISNNSGSSLHPSLAAEGGKVQLVWQDNNSGNEEIYHKTNSNWGTAASWSNAWRVTYNSGNSRYPRIACDSTGQYLHLAWTDNNPGNYEIYHKSNNNFGSSAAWSNPTRICYSSGASSYPDIDICGSAIDIVWCDNNPGNWEIYRKQSTDQGSSFSSVSRWTYNIGASEHCRINSYTGKICWDDDNPGIKDIFVK